MEKHICMLVDGAFFEITHTEYHTWLLSGCVGSYMKSWLLRVKFPLSFRQVSVTLFLYNFGV